MNNLVKIHEQTMMSVESNFESLKEILKREFQRVCVLNELMDPVVFFPDEEPFKVITNLGEERLEPLAYATLKYCCHVFETENRNEITFEEIGEKIYADQLKPRSTIQNTVSRAKAVNRIGIDYYYCGEIVFIRYR
ncbi:MAG: hypothetical protein Q4G69_06260 [Planctomycetia bacterium]|nr:hypothetical protein [Planctomycetia bacterium]